MKDKTIALLANVVPDNPPKPEPLFTFVITRYKHFYPEHNRLDRENAERAAEQLADGARNWYHDTDYFASYRGGTRLAYYRLGWMKMATNKAKSKDFSNNRPEWKGFLERPLTDAELEMLDGWKPKPAELFELVHGLLEDGYNLSLSYSKKTKTATCTLKDENSERATAGYALSSHDTDGLSALKMAMYKHHSALNRDWTPLTGTPPKARRG